MNRQAILCVDDDAIILLSIKQELKEPFGDRFIYETALKAKEALLLIDELLTEGVELILIISDWLMPGMKGDEFLREVRRAHPTIKTMLVTGHASDAALDRIVAERLTNVILLKPWLHSDLIANVESLVGGKVG